MPAGKADLKALTSIRGIAAWWVVLYHFNGLLPQFVGKSAHAVIAQGYLAVDLFFELSGFVIALNYAEQFRAPSIPAALRFYSFRLARIYPLHIFILAMFLLNPLAITLLAGHPDLAGRYDSSYLGLSVLLMQNWGFVPYLAWNVPAWSISTEWLAYLLFPFLAWLFLRVVRRRLHAFAAAVGLLSMLAIGIGFTGGGLGADIAHLGAYRCVLEFCVGMALYYFWIQRPAGSKYETGVALFGAVICLTAYGFSTAPDFVLVPAGFAFLIYACADNRFPLARALSVTPIHFVGLISYSTYLVHYLLRDWTNFILVREGISPLLWTSAYLAATAAASILLFYYVETPGRRYMREWTKHLAGPSRKPLFAAEPVEAGARVKSD